MKTKTLELAREIDQRYFGPSPIERSVSLLENQIIAMLEEPVVSNIQKQAGDLLFGLVSLCRNQDWDLDLLLNEASDRVVARRKHSAYYEAYMQVISPRGKDDDVLTHLARRYGFVVEGEALVGRSGSYSDVSGRMSSLLTMLMQNHYRVERYQIHTVLLDSLRDHVILDGSHQNPDAPVGTGELSETQVNGSAEEPSD